MPNSNELKLIFENIYKNKIWNNNDDNIPLSGPGSCLINTNELIILLDKFIYENNCNSILDLACGDLTWISNCKFFFDDNIKYIGIDIVETLINNFNEKYKNNIFICKDIVEFIPINKVSFIILRDVIFHLENDKILQIFENIKNKFDFICITSCNNFENNNNFDKWRFSEKNIHIKPFNISNNYIIKLFERNFNRNVYIYEHSNFYNDF